MADKTWLWNFQFCIAEGASVVAEFDRELSAGPKAVALAVSERAGRKRLFELESVLAYKGASLAIAKPFLADLIAADVEFPNRGCNAVEVLFGIDANAASFAGTGRDFARFLSMRFRGWYQLRRLIGCFISEDVCAGWNVNNLLNEVIGAYRKCADVRPLLTHQVQGDQRSATLAKSAEQANAAGERKPREVDAQKLRISGAVTRSIENSVGVMEGVLWSEGLFEIPRAIRNEVELQALLESVPSNDTNT